jgi:hypothetical protein
VLLWRARATTLYSAIHIHDDPTVVIGIRDPRTTLDGEMPGWGLEAARRGPLLLAHGKSRDWLELLTYLQNELGDRAWNAEIVEHPEGPGWTEAMKHLDDAAFSERGFFHVRCANAERAKALAEGLDGDVSRAGDSVLCSVSRFRPRLGQWMSNDGGSAWWIPNLPLRVRLWARGSRRVTLDEGPLHAIAGDQAALKVFDYGVSAVAEADDPHGAMGLMQRLLDAIQIQDSDVTGGAWVGPVQPLLAAARRVQHQLRVLR